MCYCTVLSVPQHSFYAVMHFAGLKAVGESVEQPLRYYRVNLTGTINLLEVSLRQTLSSLIGVPPRHNSLKRVEKAVRARVEEL